LADQATVMSAGRVVLTGTAAKIRDKPGLMDVFFGAARIGNSGTSAPSVMSPSA
jgi:ABC-type uncharacterized transport system ATPase subunit